MKPLAITAGVLIVLAALAFTGNGDYEEAVEAEKRYCEMVKAGHWPHYNKSINCEGK